MTFAAKTDHSQQCASRVAEQEAYRIRDSNSALPEILVEGQKLAVGMLLDWGWRGRVMLYATCSGFRGPDIPLFQGSRIFLLTTTSELWDLPRERGYSAGGSLMQEIPRTSSMRRKPEIRQSSVSDAFRVGSARLGGNQTSRAQRPTPAPTAMARGWSAGLARRNATVDEGRLSEMQDGAARRSVEMLCDVQAIVNAVSDGFLMQKRTVCWSEGEERTSEAVKGKTRTTEKLPEGLPPPSCFATKSWGT